MKKKYITNYLSFAHYIADRVGNIILKNYKSNSIFLNKKTNNGTFEFVTKIDTEIENLVRTLIRKNFPDHNILGEEFGETKNKSDFTWIIDPIDGTKAFITGIPVFSFLLSLKYKHKLVFGIVDQPILKERYWNSENNSYLNKTKIKTKKCLNIEKASLAITEPEMFSDYNKIYNKLLNKFDLIRWGTDALGYMRCAEGIIDVVIERNIKLWDIAALEPIINNAGGVITTWDGRKIGANDTVCACGDKRIHKILVKNLQKFI